MTTKGMRMTCASCAGSITEVDAAFHRKVMEVNFMGVVNTVSAAIPILLKQDSGHVTVTNSLAGLSGDELTAQVHF